MLSNKEISSKEVEVGKCAFMSFFTVAEGLMIIGIYYP